MDGLDHVSEGGSRHHTETIVQTSSLGYRGVVDHRSSVMGLPAARMGDLVLQSGPHCHAPIHPALLVPTPLPHPPMPLAIVIGAPTVLIGGSPAARLSDITAPCLLPGCIPGGPGMIAMASPTVLIGGLPAARVGDQTSHVACVGPIPGPLGKVLPPGCPTVLIG